MNSGQALKDFADDPVKVGLLDKYGVLNCSGIRVIEHAVGLFGDSVRFNDNRLVGTILVVQNVTDDVFLGFEVQYLLQCRVHLIAEGLIVQVVGVANPVNLKNDDADQCHRHRNDYISQIPVHDAKLHRRTLISAFD